ncbi:MATE family efflux transporter [Bifidobacterium sp. ESL0732]|uniref:MATE family efflux transporter n=1 Tax=Bifidobacterium sp. ESL0732 TaxID=2983222 RepID=UPI0023F770A2|nr:MATE family efflux transporter [Bifidobacterium sp. ESL0732]WEV63569.1 MATE family efflux transporter [Bifidobacterium sp. ESL0732]
MTKEAEESSSLGVKEGETGQIIEDSSRSSFLRLIAPLALPMAAQQFMVALSSCADSLMMTGIGQNELAGVSLATQFQFVFSLFLTALTVAMSTLIAQYWGIKDREAVSKVAAFVMRYVLLISLVFFLLLIAMPDALMRFMTNDPSLIPAGAEYLRISAPSYFFLAASQVLLCLMRNTGLVAQGTWVSFAGLLVHLILNVVLIYGWFGVPRMGVLGAAVSNLASQVLICLGLMLILCVHGWAHCFGLKNIVRSEPRLQRDFWHYCLPLLGNQIVWGGGFSMYTVIMGHLDGDAVAANAIANMVKDLLVCGCLGLGNAGNVIVGNMLGRNEFAKAKRTGRELVKFAILSGAITGLVILALRPLLLRFVGLSPRATKYLSVMLVVCSYYVIGKSINVTTINGIFPAGGDTKFGLLCDSVTMWVIVIPLGSLAAFVFKLPVLVVYVLLNIDEIIKLPAVFIHYRRYRWLKNVTTKSDNN